MRSVIVLLVSISCCVFARAQAQVCSGFSHDLSLAGADGTVYCTVIHDDGSGPALYAAGTFKTIGGIVSPGVARWNGTQWTAISGDLGALNLGSYGARSLLSHGGRLYAGGVFHINGSIQQSHLAAWDGMHWTIVPGSPDGPVTALGEYHGSMLVGGDFVIAGGITCNRVAGYDTSTLTWSAFGSGLTNGSVRCFATYVEPSGERLFAGGTELAVPGSNVRAIASWDGSTWSIPGGGMTYFCQDLTVNAMTVFDPGTGPKLLVGGEFYFAGNTPAHDLALWDGNSWSPLGALGVDFSTSYCFGYNVSALQVHDDGSGPALYIGGWFPSIDGIPGPNLMRYRPSLGAYETMPIAPNDAIKTMVEYGGELVTAGVQNSAGGIRTDKIGSWDGSTWHSLGGGDSPGYASKMCVHDDGSGPVLYGLFRSSSPGEESNINGVPPLQRLTQGAWVPINQVAGNYNLSALRSLDDGSGAGHSLYVGGTFSTAASTYNGVQRWNGSGWTPLGPSASALGFSVVSDLAEYDAGTGPRVFACGRFTDLGGIQSNGIARWNGQSWTALGSGLLPGEYALTMCVWDDGNGPALYVAGYFAQISGVPANNIARWDGTSWSALGTGISYVIITLATEGSGAGGSLYAGGQFDLAGGVPALDVAQWKNGAWSALGGGLGGALNSVVNSLASFDVGTGPELYATGTFVNSGAVQVASLARWDGTQWGPVGSGISLPVYHNGTGNTQATGLCLLEDAGFGSHSLWIGGNFGRADGVVSNGIARLCSNPLVNAAFCFGDGSGTACPCGNDTVQGSGRGCVSSLGVGASLTAAGVPSLSHDSVVLLGGSRPNSFVLYFQGTSQTAGGAGSVFGDGLRCAGGSVIRLGAMLNLAGQSNYPAAGNAAISTRGLVMTPGSRTYQAWYRNAAPFCTPSTFNLTNGIAVNWQP